MLSFPSACWPLDEVRKPAPGCLIRCFSSHLNGLELQERLRREKSELPIIFITGYGDVPMSVRAMKAGAVEFCH